MIFVILSELVSGESVLEKNQLKRHEENGTSYSVQLDAEINNETYENIDFQIQERVYTEAEFDRVLERYLLDHVNWTVREGEHWVVFGMNGSGKTTLLKDVAKSILKNNLSTENIESDIALPDQLEGYPFFLEWEISDRNLIDYDGHVKNDQLIEQTIIEMRVLIKYEEYERIYEFPIMVCPKELSEKDRIRQNLIRALEDSENKSREEEYYKLPLEINGMEISPVKDVFFDAEILSDIDDKRKMRNHVEAYKEKGCNYIDALDDQLSEALFIATDEAGVYVDVNVHMDDVSTEETLKDRVTNILSLYGNHPSLIRLLITGYVNDNENIDEFMDSFIKKDPRHLYEVEL